MTLVSQAILGARVMKMSGWVRHNIFFTLFWQFHLQYLTALVKKQEKQLEDRIAKVRTEEIKQIRK